MFVWPTLLVLEVTTVRLKPIVLLGRVLLESGGLGGGEEKERDRQTVRELENFILQGL